LGRSVVGNTLADDPELAYRIDPVRLTSPLFARRWRLLLDYNGMGAMRGCRAVTFDPCNEM